MEKRKISIAIFTRCLFIIISIEERIDLIGEILTNNEFLVVWKFVVFYQIEGGPLFVAFICDRLFNASAISIKCPKSTSRVVYFTLFLFYLFNIQMVSDMLDGRGEEMTKPQLDQTV